MKTNYHHLKNIATALSFTFVISCQLNESDKEPFAKSSVMINSETDNIREDLSIRLATSLVMPEVRSFLKQHLTRQFDKDYESLFHSLTDMPILLKTGESMLFKEILFKDFQDKNQVNLFLDNLQSNYPLLQIAMPALNGITIKDWNDNSLIPLVAYIPTENESYIPAYSSDGKIVLLSRTEAPKDLAFVISDNERVYAIRNANSPAGRSSINENIPSPEYITCARTKPTFATKHYDYYLVDGTCGDGGGGGSSGGGGSNSGAGGTSCDRDIKHTKDALNQMIFQTMDDFRYANEWFDGGQELRCKIFFASAAGAITSVEKMFSGNDTDFKNCNWYHNCHTIWFGLGNAEIVTWDKATYGDHMLYIWYEHDSGDVTTYTTSLSSTFDNAGVKTTVNSGVSFTTTADDDMLGQSIVEYCDNTDGDGYQYNTGRIYFYVRQQ